MIFPRSCRRGNAMQGATLLIDVALAADALGTAGRTSLPRMPANVILQDVHNNGYTLAFGNRSGTLASGGSERRVRLWRRPDGKEPAGWKADPDSLQGLPFLNHDRELFSASYVVQHLCAPLA